MSVTPAIPPKAAAILATIKVLVVDDNAQMRTIVTGILRSFGIRDIRQAANGTEALSQVNKVDAPHLVICDWLMEPMDGLEFTRRVRKGAGQFANPGLPIIMLTGNAGRADAEAAKEAGVTDYMVKPVVPPQLYSKLVSALAGPRGAIRSGRDALAAATPASAPVEGDYLPILNGDILALETLLGRLDGLDFDRREVWRPFYRKAHDVKGQAGSFDFWLVTAVADRLCRLLRAIEEDFEVRRRDKAGLLLILRSHVNALKVIAQHKIAGKGGATGERMLATLDQNTERLRRILGIATEEPEA